MKPVSHYYDIGMYVCVCVYDTLFASLNLLKFIMFYKWVLNFGNLKNKLSNKFRS